MQADLSQNTQAPYLEGLNPPQREAVETLDGPVLILAGAGTGKTRALTTRLAHILRTNRAFPGEILAVTFTNKAASEMKQRVSEILGGAPVEGWWLGTFHSLAARMLRRHADLVGLGSNFTIIDPDDQIRLLKQIMELENIDTKKWVPKVLMGIIDRWKDQAKTPAQIQSGEAGDIAGGKMLKLYKMYQDRLRAVNACDFGDLLLHMITIWKDPQHKDVLEDYRRRFRYILVDEYQDTNVAQYLWLRLLAQAHKNICCVGDDDQSIYGWRGAEVGNILRFENDFEGAKIIRLEQNYRSTGHILAAASGVISNNESRHDKTLWSDSDLGEKVVVRGLWDGPAEARYIGEEIEALQTKKWSLSQMAVLVRAGFQTREFEERFITLNLPYQVIGGQRFYERMEIRDALAYLRVVAQPNDDLALERIINTPKRGIGPGTLNKLYAHARGSQISLFDSVRDMASTDEFGPKLRDTLNKLVMDFTRWQSQVDAIPHGDLAGIILDESGYTDMWKMDKSPESPGRLENLKELVSAMAEFENLAQFLEHVALVMENQEKSGGERISIMTLHGAKGLEFDAIFLSGWEEGVFPSQRSMDESGLKGLEEERRLAYVGITRGRKRVTITHAANRMMYGSWNNAIPSRFIDELPGDHIEKSSEISQSSYGRSSHWDTKGAGAKSNIEGQAVTGLSWQPPKSEGKGFALGARVFHQKFGYGKVINAEGNKLDIVFETGRKRLLESFVERA